MRTPVFLTLLLIGSPLTTTLAQNRQNGKKATPLRILPDSIAKGGMLTGSVDVVTESAKPADERIPAETSNERNVSPNA